MSEEMRNIPSVDQVLSREETAVLLKRYRRDYVVVLVRRVLADLRRQLRDGAEMAEREALLKRAVVELERAVARGGESSLKRVINCTGVVLHTGLGRAPLPAAALEALQQAGENYCNLEFDLGGGKRGSRLSHIEGLVCSLSGAERAAVVNNNAAAVMLMLNSLARDREVIVSRGQLVEIGGSFRIPDVIAASGARICEVGTTNRTHLRDYRAAIGGQTAAVLVVHPSNYQVRGFTAGVGLEELAPLCRESGIPLIYDLGGGALVDLREWNLPIEPVVGESLKSGADLVSFSGDKVLGGPQSGIIAGRRELLQRIVENPMTRALRCDKLTLAALEATLQLYRLTPEQMREVHPTLRMMGEEWERLKARGERLLELLSERVLSELQPELQRSQAQAGSGALPLEEFPSLALRLRPPGRSVEALARQLRLDPEAVVGRIWRDSLLLDMRTVRDDEVEGVARALQRAVAEGD